eukprot:SAG22_NODE_139_length_18025_cov_4.352058_3_plen_417_part_00
MGFGLTRARQQARAALHERRSRRLIPAPVRSRRQAACAQQQVAPAGPQASHQCTHGAARQAACGGVLRPACPSADAAGSQPAAAGAAMPLRPIRSPANVSLSELAHVGPTPRGQRAHGRDDAAVHKPASREYRADPRAFARPWVPAASARPQMPKRSATVLGLLGDTGGLGTKRWSAAKWSSYNGPPERQRSLLNTQLPSLGLQHTAGLQHTPAARPAEHSPAAAAAAAFPSGTAEPPGFAGGAPPVAAPMTRFTSAHLNDAAQMVRTVTPGRPAYQQPPKRYQALIEDGLGGPVGRRHSDLLAKNPGAENGLGASAAAAGAGRAAGQRGHLSAEPALPGGPYRASPESRRWQTTAGELGMPVPMPLPSTIPPKFRQQGISQYEEKQRKAGAARQWWPSPKKAVGTAGASMMSWHQ